MTAAAPARAPLRAPFPWFGGKSRAAELIWSRLGDVGNYVEPFAGSLAVLLARQHEPRIETVNDRDCYLANFWRALAGDPEKVAHYADWPVNECDLHARHKWLCNRKRFRERMLAEPQYFDAKIAGWWVWGISQWIGAGWCSRPEWEGRGQGGRAPRGLNASIHLSSTMGVHAGLRDGKFKRPVLNRGARGVVNLGARPYDGGPHPQGMNHGIHAKRPHLSGNGSTGVHRKLPKMDRCERSGELIEWMLALADRLRRVRVCCGNWSRIVTPSCTWKLGGGQLTGVVLDPPYSHELRDGRLYSIEMPLAESVRKWAIEAGENRNMRIALCGLEGEHQMPASWEVTSWKARCRRIGFAMGFRKVITYTLQEESGSSLRGAGFIVEAFTKGGSWHREQRPRNDKHPTGSKLRWAVFQAIVKPKKVL